jgi:hypothetical protein
MGLFSATIVPRKSLRDDGKLFDYTKDAVRARSAPHYFPLQYWQMFGWGLRYSCLTVDGRAFHRLVTQHSLKAQSLRARLTMRLRETERQMKGHACSETKPGSKLLQCIRWSHGHV